MVIGSTLGAVLQHEADQAGPEVAAVVGELATASIGVAHLISRGQLAGDLAADQHRSNAAGDGQKALDTIANDLFLEALRRAPVAAVASEELEEPVVLDPHGALAVAIDPLDGSSNINTNISIGTIFSVLPAGPAVAASPLDAFLQRGASQVAAGFFVYGPQTSLVLTLGRGVQIFTFDRDMSDFLLAAESVAVPPVTSEYAINASNYRHWDDGIRAFVDDCIQGADGPRGKDFNMRWIACLVAEAYRILIRGGVYLYPADQRSGYGKGRLRLVYEANPIALVMERAGGGATDGINRILDLVPASLHEHTPLVFGSLDKVARIARYQADPHLSADRSPLFGRSGLLRA
jgi:fructose-1,6-bisphosphatase I